MGETDTPVQRGCIPRQTDGEVVQDFVENQGRAGFRAGHQDDRWVAHARCLTPKFPTNFGGLIGTLSDITSFLGFGLSGEHHGTQNRPSPRNAGERARLRDVGTRRMEGHGRRGGRAGPRRSGGLRCHVLRYRVCLRRRRSERVLGNLVRRRAERLFTASKIPRRTACGPLRPTRPSTSASRRSHSRLYRADAREPRTPARGSCSSTSGRDAWAGDERWQNAVTGLKRDGLVGAIGISLNRWEPWNGLAAIRYGTRGRGPGRLQHLRPGPLRTNSSPVPGERSRDHRPVPFDEGSLAASFHPDQVFPEGDFRRSYFNPENTQATMDRIESSSASFPPG